MSTTACGLLSASQNDFCLSVASIWEMAIKVSSKKLTLNSPLDEFVNLYAEAYRIELLPIESRHALAVVELPNHHRDPFDRMLITQSLVEGMPLLSCDKIFDRYGIERIW